MELGVLGCQSENNWLQWVQEDASRAELPLAKSHQEETFPIGLTVDTSIQYTLPWGENQKLPPMPLVCIYSHEGLLCLFFAVNLLQLSADSLCSPPQLPSDLSGLSLFTNAVRR
ncbi:nuclear pore complex protein Nup214-like [Lycorma delicatula]|uniref:nuclear pore complex protein Nup214-like n=1 Tax=Lycorma delicatula TaxID=130591 RepID=UPI003F513A03